MQRPAQRYQPSTRRYNAQVADWMYPARLEVHLLDGAGNVRVEGHRYFVSEALSHQSVALERVGQQVLVRFRHMYIRELNLVERTTLAFVYPVTQVCGQL